MADGAVDTESGELTPRDPALRDLGELCAELQKRDAMFVIFGGVAILPPEVH